MNGLFISKPNKDVTKAQKKDLIFDSEANQWKIHLKVERSFTAASQTKTLAHGLGYTPAFLSFEKVSGNNYYNYASTSDYINENNLSLLGDNGDLRTALILKDFGR